MNTKRLTIGILLLLTGIGHLFAQSTRIALRWASTDVRYAQHAPPKPLQNKAFNFVAWKGERVNAQAVLWANRDLTGVQLKVSHLSGLKSTIPSEAIRAQFVRYVMTDGLDKDGGNQCGARNKADFDSLQVADILDIAETVDVNAHTVQPIWINVWVPAQTPAGVYKGTLTVLVHGQVSKTLPIELKVVNRVLPQPKDWAFHLDLWQNPYAVARYNKVPLWSEAHFQAMRPVMQLLADAGQKVVTATIMDRPWNGQTEDAFGTMVTKIKRIDGTWQYDYTIFDKWVTFMQEIGIDKQINCYSMIPWALEFDYFDQATQRMTTVKATPGSAEYNTYWGSFMADFARHLRQKGWFDKTMIAMDERPLNQMEQALRLIKSVEPDFKVSLAGNYHQQIEKEIDDLCLAFGHEFPADVKARRQREGQISTVYTCCSEALPNTYTFSPPAEATWIGWYAMAKNYDGYLRWAYNSWTADPMHDSRFRTWAAGDCYLVYPEGRSSIRMERLIEGIQDYEKIRILTAEWTANKNTAQLKRLQKVLDRFNIRTLIDAGAADAVAQARIMLNNIK